MKKVSIIIPIYNRCEWLGELFKRIHDLAGDYEVIVVDDGSTDGTHRTLLKKYVDRKEVSVFRQQNAGPAAARNLGFSHSSGEYIQFLDSDDFLTKDKLARQAAYLDEHTEVSVVYGSWRMGEDWESSSYCAASENQDMVTGLLEGRWNPNLVIYFAVVWLKKWEAGEQNIV